MLVLKSSNTTKEETEREMKDQERSDQEKEETAREYEVRSAAQQKPYLTVCLLCVCM